MKPILRKGDVYDILQDIEDIGDAWHRDNIPGPSQKVLRDAGDIFGKLSDDYGILPKFIAQTKAEGLYAEFRNGHRVVMEIYNAGGALILIFGNDGKHIESIDINSFGMISLICVTIPKILAS